MNLKPVFCGRFLLLPSLFYCCVHPELLCKTSTRRVLQIFVTCFFRKKISQEIWVSLVYSDDIALFLDIWSFGITNIHIVFYKFSMLFFKVFGSLWVGTKYSIPYIRVGNVFGAKLLAPSCSTTPKTIETIEL